MIMLFVRKRNIQVHSKNECIWKSRQRRYRAAVTAIRIRLIEPSIQTERNENKQFYLLLAAIHFSQYYFLGFSFFFATCES